jgi:hypothetical protein
MLVSVTTTCKHFFDVPVQFAILKGKDAAGNLELSNRCLKQPSAPRISTLKAESN